MTLHTGPAEHQAFLRATRERATMSFSITALVMAMTLIDRPPVGAKHDHPLHAIVQRRLHDVVRTQAVVRIASIG